MSDRGILYIQLVLWAVGAAIMLFVIINDKQDREKEELFRNDCLRSGNIPIEQYCVKAGSFVEVRK